MSAVARTGLQALPTFEESVLVLIDHQPFHVANVNSHEPTLIVNNVVGLAETAKAFGVPTILTTVAEGAAAISSKSCRTCSRSRSRSTGRSSTPGRMIALWRPSRRPGAGS